MLVIAALVAVGLFYYYQSVERDNSSVEPLDVKTDDQQEQMFAAAREYIKSYSVEGMEVDLSVIKQVDKWVMLEVVPINIETDTAVIILEKVGGKWEARDFGTYLPGWQEKVPELFE